MPFHVMIPQSIGVHGRDHDYEWKVDPVSRLRLQIPVSQHLLMPEYISPSFLVSNQRFHFSPVVPVMNILIFLSVLWTVAIVTGYSCPSSAVVEPCFCESAFRRRSATAAQNQYHITCRNATYTTLKAIFKNISTTQGVNEVFDHFSGTHLFADGESGFIEDDFLSGLKIRSLSITHSNVVSFGPKAFRGVIDFLDLSNNHIDSLPNQLNLVIKKANLSNNKIREIGPNMFAAQTIDLSNNEISLIRENAFKVDAILHLNLENNRIHSNGIQSGFIRSFSKLSDLSLTLLLANNNLTYLDQAVFSPLLSSPETSVSVTGNPILCDCRVKWILDSKRYDKTWSTVHPRIENAVCNDGFDLVRDFYDSELNDCVQDIARDDPDILTPCKLLNGRALRCYRSSYESIRNAITPLNYIFSSPVTLDQILLERVIFSEESVLEATVFEFFRSQHISLINTNAKSISSRAFEASVFYTKDIELKNNRFADESLIFPFVSKFVNLERLDVSGNQLTTIPGQTFARMMRLQSVNLQNNALKVVARDAFAVPPSSPIYRSLRIDLQNNDLSETSFEQNYARVDENIRLIVNLERNKISQLTEFITEILGKSPHNYRNHAVILNENPLVCTNLIREIMRKYFVTFEDCDDYGKAFERTT